MSDDIRAFFESYRVAFNELDGGKIARLYAIPSGILSDTGYVHWPTFDEVQQNFNELCTLYKKNGYVGARFTESTHLPQGPDSAFVDMAWTIDWNDGQEPWVFNTSYNLRRINGEWRILLCTAYQEQKLRA